MKYFYKEKEIHSKTEWKNAFCESYNSTGDDKHWKVGRSAECLAEDFIGNKPQGESSMIEMIKRFLNVKNISLENAKIEYASVFDEYQRPRIQDLAIWGQADNKKIFVGIEAKVDEPFGSKSIAQQRKYVNGLILKGTQTKADERLNNLVADYLNNDEKKHGNLRYQLLYYLAGSFCTKDTEIIFMPIIVYKSRGKLLNEYVDAKGKINKEAYKQFMTELGFTSMDEVVGEQIELAYHKKVSANGVEKDVYSCYITK